MEKREKLFFQEDSLYLGLPKTISDLKIREEEENLLIYLAQEVYQWIEDLVRAESDKDRLGVLLGQVYQGKDGHCIIIERALEAKYTESSQSTLCFTHESWEDIYALKENRYPDKKILGWFRSGTDLSTYDLMVQKGFFKHPWQVIYLVCPQEKQKVFFRWKGKEIVPCPFFHLYREQKTAESLAVALEEKSFLRRREKRQKNSSREIVLRRMMAGIFLLALGGGIVYASAFLLTSPAWDTFLNSELFNKGIEYGRQFLQGVWETFRTP